MMKNFYQVEIKMFGEFDIIVNGESLLNNLTRLPVIIELLQYMAANYDKEMLPNTIVEDVWPDKEYLDANKALRTYIYRLKKFLSYENSLGIDLKDYIYITNIRGRYTLKVSPDCIFDIRDFEKRSKTIFSAKNSSTIGELLEATSIYKGDFLKNTLYTHWSIPIRNMFLNSYCELNKIILDRYYNNQDYKEVVKYCEQIFEIYDLEENLNLLFLNSLMKDDRTGDALQHYSYITSKMYNELNIKPSVELKQIYAELKKPAEEDCILEELEDIPNSMQDIIAKKFPRTIKKYKLDSTRHKSAMGIINLKNNEPIYSESFNDVFNEIQDFLEIILLKDYYATIFDDVLIFYIRDEKEDFIELITEQLKKFIMINFSTMRIDLKVNLISPEDKNKDVIQKSFANI